MKAKLFTNFIAGFVRRFRIVRVRSYRCVERDELRELSQLANKPMHSPEIELKIIYEENREQVRAALTWHLETCMVCKGTKSQIDKSLVPKSFATSIPLGTETNPLRGGECDARTDL